jgi:hypothetical protein
MLGTTVGLAFHPGSYSLCPKVGLRQVRSQVADNSVYKTPLVRQGDSSSKWIAAAKFAQMSLMDPAAFPDTNDVWDVMEPFIVVV